MTQAATVSPILLSVVVPLVYAPADLTRLVPRIVAAVAPLVSDYEVIVVDARGDEAQAQAYAAMLGPDGLPNTQLFSLIQPVGHDAAAWAGVENSLGDYVLVLEPDCAALSVLPAALEQIERGRELIFFNNTVPTDRGWLQGVFGHAYRSLFKRVVGVDLRLSGALDRLFSKRVVSFMLQQPRPEMRYRILPAMAGFSKATISYTDTREQPAGRGLFARARDAWRLLLGNTVAPLRIASTLTLASAALNLLYPVYVLAIAVWKTDVAPGWTTLSLQQSGMFFMLSIIMFVLVEYLIQIIRATSSGPAYFLASEATSAVLTRREKLNIESAVRVEPPPPTAPTPFVPAPPRG